MKTTLTKLEIAAGELGFRYNDYDKLIRYLANILQNANRDGILLNCISVSVISELLRSTVNITLNSKNVWDYANREKNIVQDIADILKIQTIEKAKCSIVKKAVSYCVEPVYQSAIYALQIALKNSLSNIPVKELYVQWQKQGWDVGSRKNWPSQKLIDCLRAADVRLNFPVSHFQPTRLKQVISILNELISDPEISSLPKQRLKKRLEKEITIYCNQRIENSKNDVQNKWIDLKFDNVDVNYFDRIPAIYRDPPYVYVKLISTSVSKIGAADNSMRFKPADLGLVVCLDSRAGDKFAMYVETEVRNFLKDISIMPIPRKLDYFDVELATLAKLTLAFITSHPDIKTRIRAITATRIN